MRSLIRIFCLLIVSAAITLPGKAPAYPLQELTNDPATMARLHCRMLHLADMRLLKLTQPTLAQFAGDKSLASNLDDRTLDRLFSDFGTSPDFSFAVGRRWNTLSARERKQFNDLFRLSMDIEYNLSNTAPITQLCPVKLLTSKDNPNNIYARTVFTQQARDEKETPNYIKVMYRLERANENSPWSIGDIIINGKSFVQRHKLPLNNYITQHGIKKLERYFGIEKDTELPMLTPEEEEESKKRRSKLGF